MEHLFYKPKGFTIKHVPLGMLKQKEPPSPHGQRGLFCVDSSYLRVIYWISPALKVKRISLKLGRP